MVVIGLRTSDPKRGTLSGWLRKVTRRVLVDRWRRQARRPEMVAYSDGYFDSLPDPEERRLDRDGLDERDAMIVRNAIDRLRGSLRDAVFFGYYSGLRYREISEALKLPEGTVKVRLYRSHATLAPPPSLALNPR
jgi:RNA polymerase sigma-70 factor (ECF subfamily)